MTVSAMRLLEKFGVEFRLLPNESCCGYILYILSDLETAEEIAQRNVKTFEDGRDEARNHDMPRLLSSL